MYVVFLGVGAGFILVSLVIGEIFDSTSFSFLRPTLIAVFLAVTGGLGLLLTPRLYDTYGSGFVLTISALSGLFVAGLINHFIIRPLHRAQSTSAFYKQSAVGMTAKVISPILPGGYGKIQYSVSGSVVTGPAKSEDGGEISAGENVDIIQIEESTYFVRRQADTTETLQHV